MAGGAPRPVRRDPARARHYQQHWSWVDDHPKRLPKRLLQEGVSITAPGRSGRPAWPPSAARSGFQAPPTMGPVADDGHLHRQVLQISGGDPPEHLDSGPDSPPGNSRWCPCGRSDRKDQTGSRSRCGERSGDPPPHRGSPGPRLPRTVMRSTASLPPGESIPSALKSILMKPASIRRILLQLAQHPPSQGGLEGDEFHQGAEERIIPPNMLGDVTGEPEMSSQSFPKELASLGHPPGPKLTADGPAPPCTPAALRTLTQASPLSTSPMGSSQRLADLPHCQIEAIGGEGAAPRPESVLLSVPPVDLQGSVPPGSPGGSPGRCRTEFRPR